MGRLQRAWKALIGADASEQRDGSLENPGFPITPTNLSQVEMGGTGSAGVYVTPWKALGYTPLYQAVSMISGDVTKLGIKAYQKRDGKRTRIEHPAQAKLDLYKMANEEISGLKFIRRLMASALLHNNGYAYIDWSRDRTQILGLYNLLPDRTQPLRVGGKLKFTTTAGAETVILEPWEVMHVEGVCVDGLQGADIIKLFREDLAVALARRGFTARFFEAGMSAGGILSAPPTAKPEAVRKVEAGVSEKFSGGKNAFKTIVLRDGFKWYSTQVNPEQAQLSEMDADQARSIARIYNLDPSKLGVPGSTSYNHSEMAQRAYYDSALSPWVLSVASECNIKLLSDTDRANGIYLEHEINSLLWADAGARADIAAKGIQAGRFSPNETRGWENLDPYEGGDDYWIQANLGRVGDEDAESDAQEMQSPSSQTDTEDESDTEAIRMHLEKIVRDTLERAHNRCAIRAKKGKRAVEEDSETLLEMLVSPLVLASRDEGTAREAAEQWIIGIFQSEQTEWQSITERTLERVLR